MAALSDQEQQTYLAEWGRTDLYFLLRYLLKATYADNDWVFSRCREVQASPNGHLDLWAREHFKSTIITYALTIQDVLNDPEITVGIFSHTRPIAKGFLRQIMREFEGNEDLKRIYPDVLWQNPRKEAPKWSEDDGIVVKRRTNPKESTVEAWGVVDGQPTSKHFAVLNYDDIVTKESVGTPDMMAKTTDALVLSYNLGKLDGKRRFIGTRYHYNDSYRTVIERGSVTPRIYPATVDGKVDGEPVFLSRETLADKRRDMGPYVFGCFIAGTSVLMGDWAQKPIEDVAVGEEVVGYTFGNGERARLVRTKVLARQSRMMPVVRFVFESGRSIVGTRDHKFWHGRAGRAYSQLGLGYGELQAACSVFDPRGVDAPFPSRQAGYLAGMFDGEGSVTGGTVHIAQSERINPGICRRIEAALTDCGIEYGCTTPSNRPDARDYYVTGGRQGLIRFLSVVGEAGKAPRLADQMFERGTRNIGKGTRDRLVAIEDAGEAEVFNIQTEAGNYVANGYAVKNCQMLQDPTADQAQGFKREWLKFYKGTVDHRNMVKLILCDPANDKKAQSDYTSMWVLGFNSDGKVYVLDIVRDRLNLTERTAALFALHRAYQPMQVGYERYGKDADIQHIESEMEKRVYNFVITELGGPMPKNDRIRRLIPKFEQGEILLPATFSRTNYEGRTEDLTRVFVDDEYTAFPVAAHDDMLDALARMCDEKITVTFPMAWGEDDDYDRDRANDTRNKVTGY